MHAMRYITHAMRYITHGSDIQMFLKLRSMQPSGWIHTHNRLKNMILCQFLWTNRVIGELRKAEIAFIELFHRNQILILQCEVETAPGFLPLCDD